MPGIKGAGGAVYLAAQASTSFTNEALTNSGDNLTYQVTNSARRLLDDSATLTLQRDNAGGGVWSTVTATEYTVNHATGQVTFLAAQAAANQHRFSVGKYFTATQVATAYEWTLDIEKQLEEDTEFGATWESFLPVMGKASGSVKLHWAAGMMAQLTSSTPRFVLVLYVDTANSRRYQFYALLSKDGVSVNVKSLVEETIDFQSVAVVNYVPS